MNLKRILLALLGTGALLCACQQEEDLGTPKVTVTPSELNLPQGDESQPVELLATRDWYITGKPDWAALSIEEGKASSKPQSVTVSVSANPGYNRTGEIIFNIGLAKAALTIHQDGAKGELRKGTGTLEDPYTVAGVIEFINGLGKDVNSENKVFVKGKVCRLGEQTYSTSGTYGNATFWMSDNGEVNAVDFYCYRILYLGNKKYTSAAGDDIKVGDDVIVCGQVVNFRGNTPETVQNGAYLYSLNGKTEGGSVDPVDPGSIQQITVADFISKADGNTYYRLSGKVANFKKGTNSSGKNWMQFDLKDDTGSILVYGFKDGQYDAWVNKLSDGGTVVLNGTYEFYSAKSQHEVMNATIESFTAGSTPPDNPGEVQQITCAEFIAKADESTTYRLVGEVTSSVNTTYCSFDMNDGTATVVVWTVNNKEDWKDVVKKGGIVTVRGKYKPYTQSDGTVKHEMVDAYIEDFKAGSGGNENTGTPSGNGTLESPYNAAAAKDVASKLDSETKTDDVYLAGKICSVKYAFDEQHGTATFDISDDGSTSGATFTCYSVYYLGNTSWKDGQTQVKVGDSVIIYGKLCNYQGNTPETASKSAYIYSLNGKTEPEEVQGGGGGDEPSGDLASNVTWTEGSNYAYTQKANVNGTEVTILKLGTGSAAGSSTITCPAASSKLSFYAISWKDKPSELVFKVGGTQVASVKPAANAGLSGNPTYKITVSDSDHYTIELGSGVTELTVETTGSNTRAALFAIVAE